jgi:hypothetical protein
MLTPEQRLKQAYSWMSLKIKQAFRDYEEGRVAYIEGDWNRKAILRAIRLAYEAGRREAGTK